MAEIEAVLSYPNTLQPLPTHNLKDLFKEASSLTIGVVSQSPTVKMLRK